MQLLDQFDSQSSENVARGVSLFRFLEARQRLSGRIIRSTADFKRSSETVVIWLEELATHPRVRLNTEDPEAPLLSIRHGAQSGRGQPGYDDLFGVRLATQAHSEELELVLGLGLLAYAPSDQPAVCRHLLTVPVRLELDENTGRLDLRTEAHGTLRSEARHFLDSSVIADKFLLEQGQKEANNYAGNMLDARSLEPLLVSMVTAIDPAGKLVNPDTLGDPGPQAQVAIAPALIFRERLNESLPTLLADIAERIQASGRVPSGLLPFIDPDHTPRQLPDPEPGAMVDLAGDQFLPLPVNDTQRKVLDHVDHHSHVVVQGPPGTGKTHLISTLLTHLLAQGKRVLVTAQTDKALAEVRERIPARLRPLAASVLNAGSGNADHFEEAVKALAQESLHDDADARRDRIRRHLLNLERMSDERTKAYAEIVAIRAHQTRRWPESGVDDTLAGIRRSQRRTAADFDWLLSYVGADHIEPAVDGADLARYRELAVTRKAGRAEGLHLVEHVLPDPAEFSRIALRREESLRRVRPLENQIGHRWAKPLLSLPPVQRKEFGDTLITLRGQVGRLQQANSSWLGDALNDVLAHRGGTWAERRARVSELHTEAKAAAARVATHDEVVIAGEIVGLEPLANALLDHVRDTPVKLDAQGRPRLGFLTPRPVRAGSALFERVTVNGHPPVTEADLTTLIGHLGLARLVRLLDAESGRVTRGALTTRLREHTEDLQQLTELVELRAQLAGIDEWFARQGWETPDWSDFTSGHELIATVEALPDLEHEASTRRAMEKLRKQIAVDAGAPHAARCVHQLLDAVENGDVNCYTEAYEENQRLLQLQREDLERTHLGRLIEQFSPELARDLARPDSADTATWARRLRNFDAACAWVRTQQWLSQQVSQDDSAARQRVGVLENEIIRIVEQLAAERAWAHALAPDRLTTSTRAALVAFEQQVRQLGKGTGQHADRLRAEIRETINECRDAVPVWIMPLYRVIEQAPPARTQFDVVIVDEASQASLDALFLHCLAPRIVVVGDDKQVSPAGVGQDRQLLRQLVQRHVPDLPYAQLWANPMRSLFDEATMRYGCRLVLTEHHRSVPQIIEFCSQEFYEPDGVHLAPIRQFDHNGLDPFRMIYVAEGTVNASTVNEAEVEALVTEVENCLADPRYAGLTMGVVTLLGSAQAKAIEKQLMQRLPVQEWTGRRMLCGEAPAFQGSERDVIFVSMVAAPTGRRLVAQTQEIIAQRYNVAISRARDQVVLVHSLTPEDLNNADDLRHRLLTYATSVVQTTMTPQKRTALVPENVMVPPFESLLEQQIFNMLVRDGYQVHPQQQLLGARVDLVVQGRQRCLAVECEDEAWDGELAYARQVRGRGDLEASGWRFVTVRRVQFDDDPDAAYGEVTEALAELGIEATVEPLSANVG